MYVSELPVARTGGTIKSPDRAVLDKDQFFKILTMQLQYQDPFKPMDQSQFISQMAQLSVVEQLQSLNRSMTDIIEIQLRFNSILLLGRRVSVEDSEGNQVKGKVEAIKFTPQGTEIRINGYEYLLSQVNQISLDGED